MVKLCDRPGPQSFCSLKRRFSNFHRLVNFEDASKFSEPVMVLCSLQMLWLLTEDAPVETKRRLLRLIPS
jgi:hypothetical protein